MLNNYMKTSAQVMPQIPSLLLNFRNPLTRNEPYLEMVCYYLMARFMFQMFLTFNFVS